MDILTTSTDFMSYMQAIQEASFGQRSKPPAIADETIQGISSNARSQEKYNELGDRLKSNTDNRQDRVQMAAGTYNPDGTSAAPRTVAGVDIVV